MLRVCVKGLGLGCQKTLPNPILIVKEENCERRIILLCFYQTHA